MAARANAAAARPGVRHYQERKRGQRAFTGQRLRASRASLRTSGSSSATTIEEA